MYIGLIVICIVCWCVCVVVLKLFVISVMSCVRLIGLCCFVCELVFSCVSLSNCVDSCVLCFMFVVSWCSVVFLFVGLFVCNVIFVCVDNVVSGMCNLCVVLLMKWCLVLMVWFSCVSSWLNDLMSGWSLCGSVSSGNGEKLNVVLCWIVCWMLCIGLND